MREVDWTAGVRWMSEQSSYFTLYFHMGGTFYIMLNSAVTDPPKSPPLMAMIQFQWWGGGGGGGSQWCRHLTQSHSCIIVPCFQYGLLNGIRCNFSQVWNLQDFFSVYTISHSWIAMILYNRNLNKIWSKLASNASRSSNCILISSKQHNNNPFQNVFHTVTPSGTAPICTSLRCQFALKCSLNYICFHHT